MVSSQILEHVWGYNDNYYFATFPFIRMFFTGGHLAVSIFFVISGYVLAAKPLALIQSGDTAKMAENVGSALFRRWIRLFLPVAGVTFLWMSSWHLLNFAPSIPMAPQPTYFGEVWKWWLDFKAYSFVFSPFQFNAYSFHAWSIPMEFRGSIVVYTTLLAIAGLDTSARLRVQCALMFYFMYLVDGWFCAMFICGMFLCDIETLHVKKELPSFYAHILTQPKKFYYFLLIAGIYLGGAPASSAEVAVLRKSPGWYYLSFLTPEACQNPGWFFRFWGATFIMIVIPRLSWLHSFFETRFCQYLGRISYALYLVHGPILWSFGDRVYAAVGLIRWGHETIIPKWMNYFPLPEWGIYGIEVNWLMAQMLLFPLTIYIAEIFTRLVDEPSVKLAQWLFKKHVEPKRESVV
jgi:peptidoglycan/LPS O-acetylase OafA/YrhL